MVDDYKKLLEASEHQCSIQQKIIDIQTEEIDTLKKINSVLEKEKQHLEQKLSETQDLCDRQQTFIDTLIESIPK